MDLDLAVQVTCPPAPGEDFTFVTTETDAAFLVLAHLPGYAKDEIEVRVGAAGTEVAVACASKDAFTVDATVGRLCVAHRQVVDGFRRVFDVPPGADVARITVGFDEDDGLLVVILPKLLPSDGDEEEAWLDDEEASSLELEHEDWVDVESEPEPPPRDVLVVTELPVVTDVAVETPPVPVVTDVAVETPVPVGTDVAVETPLEVEEEDRDVPVETAVEVEAEPWVVDIECDVVFEPPPEPEPSVEMPIEVLGPPHREPDPPADVPQPPVDIPCDVVESKPLEPAVVQETEEPKPPPPPAEEPVEEEPPGQEEEEEEEPVQEPAAEEPVREEEPQPVEAPAEEPMQEPTAEEPVQEQPPAKAPAEEPVSEPPAEEPTVELPKPATPPVEESRSEGTTESDESGTSDGEGNQNGGKKNRRAATEEGEGGAGGGDGDTAGSGSAWWSAPH